MFFPKAYFIDILKTSNIWRISFVRLSACLDIRTFHTIPQYPHRKSASRAANKPQC
jgi:hypothetical protein